MATHDSASVVRAVFDAINRHDADRAANLMAHNLEWLDVQSGRTFHNRDSFKQLLENFFTGFPDLSVDITNLFSSGDWVCVEYSAQGTNTGLLRLPLATAQSTGRRIDIPFCDVYRVQSGKIVSGRSYWDTAILMRQLGLLPMARQLAA